jgi:hypothetical protein
MNPSYEPANRHGKRIDGLKRLAGKLRQAVDLYSQALERTGDSEDEGGQINATLLSNKAMTPVKVRLFPLSLHLLYVPALTFLIVIARSIRPGIRKHESEYSPLTLLQSHRTGVRINLRLSNYESGRLYPTSDPPFNSPTPKASQSLNSPLSTNSNPPNSHQTIRHTTRCSDPNGYEDEEEMDALLCMNCIPVFLA